MCLAGYQVDPAQYMGRFCALNELLRRFLEKLCGGRLSREVLRCQQSESSDPRSMKCSNSVSGLRKGS